jgi:DNA-binding LytR/AlgR family response regulator
MINIAVVDDIREDMLKTTQIIHDVFYELQTPVDVVQYSGPLEFKKDIENGVNFRIAFLDIEMPELNGIEVAKNLKDAGTIVIFVSAKEEFVFQALQIYPFAFARKRFIDYDLPRYIKGALEKVKQRISRENSKALMLESRNKVLAIHPYRIMYATIKGRTVTFYQENGKTFEFIYKMKQLAAELDRYDFIQVSRDAVVNCSFILEIKNYVVIMDDGTEFKVPKPKIDDIKSEFCIKVRD